MSRSEPEFYVNYFPVPPALRRFLRRAVPVIASVMAMVAAGVALAMRHPGQGRWTTDIVALEGVVLDQPWPVLRVREGGQWSTVLLVEHGKLGADRAVRQAGAAGRRARVHGTVIQRDGRRVLELAPRPGAIEDLGVPTDSWEAAAHWGIERLGDAVLEGEIVDPKCYLGAMQPGEGAVHRACARVCIAGGIPAGLISPAEDGGERFALLIDGQGRADGERWLEWVGVPVRVQGGLERWGDLLVVRVAGLERR